MRRRWLNHVSCLTKDSLLFIFNSFICAQHNILVLWVFSCSPVRWDIAFVLFLLPSFSELKHHTTQTIPIAFNTHSNRVYFFFKFFIKYIIRHYYLLVIKSKANPNKTKQNKEKREFFLYKTCYLFIYR